MPRFASSQHWDKMNDNMPLKNSFMKVESDLVCRKTLPSTLTVHVISDYKHLLRFLCTVASHSDIYNFLSDASVSISPANKPFDYTDITLLIICPDFILRTVNKLC
jgi:hypothetical protein